MRNYLIGFGERLVHPISIKGGGGPKRHPYTFEMARARLEPEFAETIGAVSSLPPKACPRDEAVVALALHPSYLAKSYFPEILLRETGLRAVGSRAVYLPQPARTGVKIAVRDEEERAAARIAPAPEIFVAGPRRLLREFGRTLSPDAGRAPTAEDVRKVARLRPLSMERVRSVSGDEQLLPLEIILHAPSDPSGDQIIEGFRAWARDADVNADLDQRIQTGGLCFLPVRAPREALEHLAQFAFLRVLRRMPRLRLSDAFLRAVPPSRTFHVTLPGAAPLNPEVKVAIFDGGCPAYPEIDPWVTRLSTPDTGPAIPDAERHGLGVTSAVLFGPLRPGAPPPVPWARVDHWQVIDAMALADDGTEMYNILRRIHDVLSQRHYDFVNLSIGPDLPIEDDEVHAWTSVIDHHLATGQTVLTNAVGNTGELDRTAGLARIQPCSDAVNGIGVGAADSLGVTWARAPYSSIGPGRSPGFVKPDVVAFGGSPRANDFHLLDMDQRGHASGRCGTSFSSPSVCRAGIGIRAHFGPLLQAPAVKALLVHHADAGGHHRYEVGWGRLPHDLEDFVVCQEGDAHIVYQGKLSPSQWMRFPVPEPLDGFTAPATLRATFCYFTTIDPEDSLNYTRAGLGIVFRPNTVDAPREYVDASGKRQRAANANPAQFFQGKGYHSTEAQRRDAHKWETTLRAERRFHAGTLKRPVFDVEHQARLHGGPAARRADVPYALILSIMAPEEPDLYNRVLRAYRNRLEILRPLIEVPVAVRPRG